MGSIAATCLLNADRELLVAFDNQMTQQWLLSNDENSAVDSVVRSWKAHDAPVRVLVGDTSRTAAGVERRRSHCDGARHCARALHARAARPRVSGHCARVPSGPARHMLLSGDEGGVVYRWNLLDRKGVPTEAHTSAVTAIAVTPDGKRAVSAEPRHGAVRVGPRQVWRHSQHCYQRASRGPCHFA
jgi:hypothetical protein